MYLDLREFFSYVNIFNYLVSFRNFSTCLPLLRKHQMQFKLLIFVLKDKQINITFLTLILDGKRCSKILGDVLY